MRSSRFLLPFLSFVLLLSACSLFQPQLELEKGDRVVIIGNTLAERMQYFGHFETLLHSRFPEHQLVVRNLGYSADEVAFRPRSLNFGSPDDHLAMWEADVILAFFGFNESFAGPEGLDEFKSDLEQFIVHTLSQRYNGESAPRLALVSPIAHESLDDNFPDPGANNANLELYARAVQDLASQHGVVFVDLFHRHLRLHESGEQLSFNGVHLTEAGDARIARLLDEELFGAHPDPDGASARLRAEVNEKNFVFFHRYRAVNGYYIYGGRSQRDNGNPPFTDAYVLENERRKLDDMTAIRDRRIWSVAAGRTVAETIDDSATRPLYDVPTNFQEPTRILPPEQAIETFRLAPGYAVNLFASEVEFPELKNPVQLTFDARGRLWVLTMPDYPMFQPPQRPNDKLVILEDTDQDGRADKLKVFADGLHVPTGFELGDGGAYVAQQPNLMFLKDTDGDDKADVRELILHGFDSADSHHSISAFTWGPGGGLYMHEGTFHHTSVETHSGPVRNAHGGVYRFDPTTHNFETFVSYNFANPWGHVFDGWGQSFVADASGGANYFATAFSGKAPQFTGQPDFGPFKFVNRSQMKQFIVKRVRPTAGCEIVSSRHFPPTAQGNFLLNNVIGFQGILQHRMEDEGSGFKGTEIEPILFSSDRNFRPVDLQFGPDGALYVVDWFNPLVGHMQHNLRDPNRDKTHGRVWRITYPSRPLLTPPWIEGQPVEALLELLKSPEDRTRYRVRLELREHRKMDVWQAINRWVEALDPDQPDYEHHLLEALWVLQHHNAVDEELLKRTLRSPDYRARAAATRVLSHWRKQLEDALELLEIKVDDEHPRVRLEAVRATSFFTDPEAARISLRILNHPMDDYLHYTLGETIRTLQPYWQPFVVSGSPLAEDATGTEYLLSRLEVDDLEKVARNEAAYRAFLSRPGVKAEHRAEGLIGLAESNATSPVVELIKAIRRIDSADSDEAESVLLDLGQMLQQPWLAREKERRGDLKGLLTSKRALTRRLVWAGLIASDQDAEAVWSEAGSSSAKQEILESIPLLLNPSVRLWLFPKVAEILENPSDTGSRSSSQSLRRAAIEALPSIEGRETESMRILVELMRTRPADPVPVRSVLGFPRENIPGETATLLTESLLRHLRSLPAKERTSEEALGAADLIRHVSAFLPEESANTVAADLADLSVTVIVIKPLPHRMQFDLAEFSVPAGRPVEIVFENVDIMPHNLLVTSPGALTEVGMLAEEMASRPDAFERQFIPDSSKVLYATRMLQPRQIEKLQFTAPEKPDDYPYVCTFPGHWRTMFGTMRVVEPGIAPPPPVRITDESTVLEVRDFVQAWKTQDLVGVLGALDADRDFENGALLFETLSCSKCHRMNGEGGEIGPDLTEVLDKLASGEMDRAGLLREVVEPSRVVAEEYKTAVIRTSDGRIFTGMVLDEDDRVVRLIPNALEPDQVDEVSKDSIESRRQSSVSPMPEGLVNTASQRDILDLLAYLATSGGLRKMAER